VLAFRCDLRLGCISFVWPHVILLQGGENGLHASIHLRLIIAGAILREQKLQDERRDVGALLDAMEQILAKHFPIESLV
jgi:hypothetical protein